MNETIKNAILNLARKSIREGGEVMIAADRAMKHTQAALNLAHVASILQAIEQGEKTTGAGS